MKSDASVYSLGSKRFLLFFTSHAESVNLIQLQKPYLYKYIKTYIVYFSPLILQTFNNYNNNNNNAH